VRILNHPLRSFQKLLTILLYQTFQELLEDLQIPTDSVSKKEKREKSIVVLPFDDMSPEKNNEYFSDGLTEEIIADLSHIQDLLVISRTSAMRLKGTDKDIKTIGREILDDLLLHFWTFLFI